MDISESSTRHYEKRRSTVESPESPRDRDRDGEDEDWDVSERRRDRHRSSKSRKRGNPDEYSEDWQQTGSRRKSGSGKKKLVTASSGRAGSGDEDEYDDKGVIGPRSDDYGTRGSNADNKRDRDKLDKKSSSGYQDATRKMKEENAGAKPEDDRSRQHAFTDYDRNLPRKATGTIRAGKTETTAVKAASGYETSQSRNRGKTSDFYRESDAENAPQERGIARQGSDDTARYTERKGSGKEKGQGGKGSSKYEKDDNGRRWDEADYSRSTPKVVNEDLDIDKGDRRVGRGREKLGGGRERENETNDFPSKSKSRFGEALTFHNEGKPARASDRDERRTEEAERRPKGKGRLEMHADDEDANKAINMDKLDDKQQRRIRDTFDSMAEDFESWEKSGGQRQSFKVQEEKSERHKNFREYGHGRWDEAENWDIQDNEDEHVERGRMKEKRDMGWEDIEDRGRSGRGRSGRGVRHMKRSWSPEGRKRARRDSEEFDREFSDDRGDSDTERSISLKGKDRDRDVYREDRPREKDSDWMERSRDWEGSKDHRKSRYYDRHDKDLKGEEGDYDFERDWEFHGRERERLEREKVQRVVTDRKDRGRLEGVKSVTSFGSSNDALDRRAGSLDYGRGDSGSAFGSSRRNDIGGPSDFMGEGDWGFPPDDRGRMGDVYAAGIDSRERYDDDAPPGLDQNFGMNPGRITPDGSNMHGGRGRGHKGSLNNRGRGAGQMGNGGQSSFGSNQGSGSFTRMMQQGGKGGRGGRGRGRVQGRDTQRGGIPLPMMGPGPGPGVPAMGPPFGPLGLPPGALQAMGPGMGPAPGPPMGPGGFLPPPYAAGHMVWGGGRGGGEMNILAVPPGLSPVPPPGPSGPRFVPNMGPGPNQGVYFNQPGPVRGASPNMSGAGYGSVNPMGRGMVNEKANVGRVPPRITGPPGKAPSRGEQNDYSQNFVDTGMRPQNFIRELELTNVVEDYPKLRELIQKKDEIVAKSACPPMYLKCDLRETVLAPELFGTKFDVILVDPPWEEYVHRAPGVGDHMEYWTFEEIQNIKIEVAETRFASHTLVLRRLLKVRDTLSSMVINSLWSVWKQSHTERALKVRALILSEKWWDDVEYVLNFTEPIMSMIRYADTDRPCLGEIYDGMDCMVEKIKEVINRKENDPTETFFKVVQKIVVDRWNKMTTPLHLLAFALTPKFYSAEMLATPRRVPPYRDAEVASGYRAAFKKIYQDEETRNIVMREFGQFVSAKNHDVVALNARYGMDADEWWYVHGQGSIYLQPLAIKLNSQAIADTPSFIFLWVGDGVGLEQGRLCLKKWGFRRCEDICWVKTNKANPSPGLRHDSHTLFQHSKEHCLMGIKGTVRRSTDGHIIHANIDTDIIIAEEPPQGSTTKPEDLYRIIEHFALGRRRLELFGEDHNIRAGWLTVGKGLSSSNFNSEGYIKNFLDKDGKVWQGGAGRNPPPDAPHLVGTSPEIESLRPKSPPQKSQQQQTNSVSQPAANSTSKKASSTSPGPAQNTQPSAVATSVGGSAQEVQVSNALGSVPALPVSEMSRTGSSVPINEQRPVPVHPSSSKTSSMGPRAGLEVDGSTEEEKFLDAGTPGNLDSQK